MGSAQRRRPRSTATLGHLRYRSQRWPTLCSFLAASGLLMGGSSASLTTPPPFEGVGVGPPAQWTPTPTAAGAGACAAGLPWLGPALAARGRWGPLLPLSQHQRAQVGQACPRQLVAGAPQTAGRPPPSRRTSARQLRDRAPPPARLQVRAPRPPWGALRGGGGRGGGGGPPRAVGTSPCFGRGTYI